MKKADRDIFNHIIDQTASQEVFCRSIQFLSRCLEQYHGKKAVILIDEYDVPLDKAYQQGHYPQMIMHIRSLFSQVLKTNQYLSPTAALNLRW